MHTPTKPPALHGQTTGYVVTMYSVLTFLSVTIFGIVYIAVEHNPITGWLQVAGGLVIALNVMVMRMTHNVMLGRDLFLLTLIALLIVMLATGGNEGMGIFWFFFFPVVAFFLTNKRQGVYWVSGLLVVIGLLWVLVQQHAAYLWYGDGVLRQLLLSLLVVSAGIYVYQQSREHAHQQSAESQQDLQEFVDHMSTLTARVAPDGTVVFANRITKVVSGQPDALVGMNFLTGPWWSFDPKVQARVGAAFARVLAGETVTYTERMRIFTSKPQDITIALSMLPIVEKQKIKYVLLEARDITQEQEVERTKSEFVTLASHQLRTPLSAIRWFSEMLLAGDAGDLAREQREHVEQIYYSNQRMASLVDDLLIVSSLELNSLPVRPEPLDIANFCSRVVKAQVAAVSEKKLKVRQHYDDDLPRLPFDPHLLRVVLRNLVSNATKYTPPTGNISLDVTVTNQKLNPQSKGSLAILVSDSGYGIPKAAQGNVFTKFFRAENIKDKDTEGSGIGLYVVKKLLEYVGGDISLTSTENVGSTVVVRIPLEGMAARDFTPTTPNQLSDLGR